MRLQEAIHLVFLISRLMGGFAGPVCYVCCALRCDGLKPHLVEINHAGLRHDENWMRKKKTFKAAKKKNDKLSLCFSWLDPLMSNKSHFAKTKLKVKH